MAVEKWRKGNDVTGAGNAVEDLGGARSNRGLLFSNRRIWNRIFKRRNQAGTLHSREGWGYGVWMEGVMKLNGEWYQKNSTEVVEQLGSDLHKGLPDIEAAQR